MVDNNVMPLSDGLESEGVYWQTYEIGQGERRLDLLLGDETMLPPDDTSPSNIIEILVANHQAKHTHANKSALDGITSENVEKWNNMGDHTHDEYVSQSDLNLYAKQSDLDLLEDVVNTKAASTHSHDEYASTNHVHSNYATQISLDILTEEVNEKANANHIHNNYADVLHIHTEYAESSHEHSNYAETSHLHDNYATVTVLNELSNVVSGKANISHSHNDLYYTETEIDTKLASKSDASHNHDGVYDVNGAAANALTSAKTYTDSKIDALVGEGASTTLDTIGEISSAIENNQDAIDLLNSAIANKANVSHTHNISNVSDLQSALDGKAASNHTHSYAGSSSVGGAATSANKLNTNAGSTTQPVYFANGIPVKTTYTLGASVPSGAKFTDTTYNAVTTSANGLMIASDKVKLDSIVLANVSEVETYLGI